MNLVCGRDNILVRVEGYMLGNSVVGLEFKSFIF